jgi:hypothetical protein
MLFKCTCRYLPYKTIKDEGYTCIVGSKRFVCASTVVESVNKVGVHSSYKNILENIIFVNLYLN